MMNKSITLISFLLILFFAGSAGAASFSAVQDMTYCNSDVHVRSTAGDPNDLIDRKDNWAPTANSSNSTQTINVLPGEYVYAVSSDNIRLDVDTTGEIYTNNMIQVSADSYSYVDMTTPDGIDSYAWAGAETVAPDFATGNFYEIVAEAGESTGDWVTVTVDYSANISTTSEEGTSNYASVYGHEGGDLLITKNCADFDAPVPSEIVYSFSKEESDGYYTDQTVFLAQVGDVIGIHCGVYTNAYTGAYLSSSESSAEFFIELTMSEGSAPFDAGDADFDGSGLVDMADLAMFASVWLEAVRPVNDDCSNPIELTVDQGISGNNYGATGESMDSCSSGFDGKDVWYVFVAPESGFYNFNLMIDDPYAFDSTFSIWGDCVDAEVDCDEGFGDEHIYNWYMNEDEVMYIRVAGYEGPYPDEGEFRISVTSGDPS